MEDTTGYGDSYSPFLDISRRLEASAAAAALSLSTAAARLGLGGGTSCPIPWALDTLGSPYHASARQQRHGEN